MATCQPIFSFRIVWSESLIDFLQKCNLIWMRTFFTWICSGFCYVSISNYLTACKLSIVEMIRTVRYELKDYASTCVWMCVSCHFVFLGLSWKWDCFQLIYLRSHFKCAWVYLSPVYPSHVRTSLHISEVQYCAKSCKNVITAFPTNSRR